ncbi:hypothetical protein [Oceanobacter sp. 4_MG-2023]|uniref:hypothetical protein n=1 Tax=Oceanobacter sp. 4_MG-2023 TaxID=3062623 RepID=UPI002735C6A4|nr:hypothetical protein [Oceanobacter sp. 4_MG-2023]MDP2548509.1 hypothetical protein [Oceanobacter sp. 4_MG-2023]
MTIQYDNNPNKQCISAGEWLEIEPCYVNFDDGCEVVQLSVNEDQVDVDVDRIPQLIDALKMAHQLATSSMMENEHDN